MENLIKKIDLDDNKNMTFFNAIQVQNLRLNNKIKAITKSACQEIDKFIVLLV